jgi:hypothetical protein
MRRLSFLTGKSKFNTERQKKGNWSENCKILN